MQTTQTLAATRIPKVDLARLAPPIVAGGMLAVALAFTLLRLVQPTDGMTGAYVTSSWTSDGMVVEPLPDSPGHGALRSGDLVTAIDGRSLDDWLAATFAPPSQTSADVPLSYRVVSDGHARNVAVPLARYPLLPVLLANWGTLVWLVAMAGVSAYLYARRPAEAATRALLVLGVALLSSTVPWILGLGPAELVAGGPAVICYLVATFGVYGVFWSANLHFALVFPKPIAAPTRQRRLVRLAYLLPALALLGWMLASRAVAPDALSWVGGWTLAQLGLVPVVIVTSVALLAVQWRRAGSAERDRLRWIFVAGIAAGLSGMAGWFLPEALTGTPLLPWSAIGLSGMAFPVALGFAVGRRGLFGIETVLHRSLVYGGLTAGVVVVYAASVVLLGTILPGEGPYAVTLLATGAAALVALPLRDRLQRSVSQLLYGDRDQPHRALVRLNRRLEASLEPDTVLPMVAETVAASLRLPYAAIELRHEGEVLIAAAHGAPRGVLERLPLVHRGEEIGWLVLAPRGAGESFTRADRELLAELARQAGAAAYAVRLTADLRRSRHQLVTTREEERRRLRRELHDGVGPSLAGSLMKLEAARELAERDPAAVDRLLAELADQTRATIEDIRRVAYDLRPPALDQLGLVEALRQQAQLLAPPGVTFEVSSPSGMNGLPAAVEVAAYRIGLEALTNVARHSGAAHAIVDLRLTAEALVVDVRDDGRGDQRGEHVGVGFTSMRERAEELGGSLEVGTAPEGGMRLTALLPLGQALGHA